MSTLAAGPRFFNVGTITAWFMGGGNNADDSEALMVRANIGAMMAVGGSISYNP